MGYYVTIEDIGRFVIKASHFDEIVNYFIEYYEDFDGATIYAVIKYVSENSCFNFELCDGDLILGYGESSVVKWRENYTDYLLPFVDFIDQTGWKPYQCAFIILHGEDGYTWAICMRDKELKEIVNIEPVWERE